MVSSAFAAHGIQLHYDIKNVVPVQTCTDNPTATPPQYCSFPDSARSGWLEGRFRVSQEPAAELSGRDVVRAATEWPVYHGASSPGGRTATTMHFSE